MQIVLDEQIQFGKEAFHDLGETKPLPSHEITPSAVKDAGMLIVRSVTDVNKALLGESRVRFVGSVTAGIDHIDMPFLQGKGIALAHAPGCNANSVAEYVMAALFALSRRRIISLDELRLGVVGVGNVGSRVAQKARGLGIHVLKNDPPLARRSNAPDLAPLDHLMDCDVVSLHVPLTREGPDRTFQLFDADLLRRMKKGAVLINSSRGDVVDQPALISCLKNRHFAGAVIDVWADEPRIDPDLLRLAAIATPHIAGLSIEGKANGTVAVYRAACRFLNLPENWHCTLPAGHDPVVEFSAADEDSTTRIGALIKKAYDIEADDSALRDSLRRGHDPADCFERARRNYPIRREFPAVRVRLPASEHKNPTKLKALGFSILHEFPACPTDPIDGTNTPGSF